MQRPPAQAPAAEDPDRVGQPHRARRRRQRALHSLRRPLHLGPHRAGLELLQPQHRRPAERLDGGSFLRIHRSYVANLDFAEQILRDDGKVSSSCGGEDDAPAGGAHQRAAPARAARHRRDRRAAKLIRDNPRSLAAACISCADHAFRACVFVVRAVAASIRFCGLKFATTRAGELRGPLRDSEALKETSTMIPAGFDYHAPRSVADADRSCSAARRRRQAARRRPQPAADDEAALRAAGAPDRPEPHRRAARHPRGRRHARASAR